MNTKIRDVFIFAIGAAVGSVVTWKLIENKYKQIADEEIESVKESFGKRFEPKEFEPEVMETTNKITLKPSLTEFAKRLSDEGYVAYSNSEITMKGGGEHVSDAKPIVISPDEFGELEYECINLNYYADGVLADDWDNVIENIDETIGEDSLTRFGEYADDTVYVRNDSLKADYEITRDPRAFIAVANQPPYRVDD